MANIGTVNDPKKTLKRKVSEIAEGALASKKQKKDIFEKKTHSQRDYNKFQRYKNRMDVLLVDIARDFPAADALVCLRSPFSGGQVRYWAGGPMHSHTEVLKKGMEGFTAGLATRLGAGVGVPENGRIISNKKVVEQNKGVKSSFFKFFNTHYDEIAGSMDSKKPSEVAMTAAGIWNSMTENKERYKVW